MMNSMANDDGFEDNPFRSGGGSSDVFFDASSASPTQPQPQQQQFQQQQQPQFQQQVGGGDPFAPQPASVQPNFAAPPPLPSGPMDNMAPQQQLRPQQQAQQQQPGAMQALQPRSWWGNCMACVTLDSYRAYFDIDADDIVNRMKGAVLHFYKPEYFRNNVVGVDKSNGMKGPDLYGPFWLTMTLIFFIGVSFVRLSLRDAYAFSFKGIDSLL